MDRITFLDSISGIQYPEMIVEFFDQFIALKQIAEDYGTITVNEKLNNGISFNINFQNQVFRDKALNNVQTGTVIIYGRMISVIAEPISDNDIKIILQ